MAPVSTAAGPLRCSVRRQVDSGAAADVFGRSCASRVASASSARSARSSSPNLAAARMGLSRPTLPDPRRRNLSARSSTRTSRSPACTSLSPGCSPTLMFLLADGGLARSQPQMRRSNSTLSSEGVKQALDHSGLDDSALSLDDAASSRRHFRSYDDLGAVWKESSGGDASTQVPAWRSGRRLFPVAGSVLESGWATRCTSPRNLTHGLSESFVDSASSSAGLSNFARVEAKARSYRAKGTDWWHRVDKLCEAGLRDGLRQEPTVSPRGRRMLSPCASAPSSLAEYAVHAPAGQRAEHSVEHRPLRRSASEASGACPSKAADDPQANPRDYDGHAELRRWELAARTPSNLNSMTRTTRRPSEIARCSSNDKLRYVVQHQQASKIEQLREELEKLDAERGALRQEMRKNVFGSGNHNNIGKLGHEAEELTRLPSPTAGVADHMRRNSASPVRARLDISNGMKAEELPRLPSPTAGVADHMRRNSASPVRARLDLSNGMKAHDQRDVRPASAACFRRPPSPPRRPGQTAACWNAPQCGVGAAWQTWQNKAMVHNRQTVLLADKFPQAQSMASLATRSSAGSLELRGDS